MLSSERRQKMKAPTINHTELKDLVQNDVQERIGARTDSPASCNARTPSGVGRSPARSEQTSDVAVHTLLLVFEAAWDAEYRLSPAPRRPPQPTPPGRPERRPRKGAGGGTARALILLIPRSGEDECGSSRVGNAGRRPDARLACHAPDYLSHSLRTARSFTLSHHNSVRASARRYEERYEQYLSTTFLTKRPGAFADLAAQRRGYLRQTDLTILGSGGRFSLQGAAPVHLPDGGWLLLWRNLYNKCSSIQGTALRARREMHWRREAVRWGSP